VGCRSMSAVAIQCADLVTPMLIKQSMKPTLVSLTCIVQNFNGHHLHAASAEYDWQRHK
jgi:hypothetical protein